MLIELKPMKRKNDEQVAADYHQNPAYQQLLRNAHVSFDWIQYKKNFRPPVTERVAFDPDCQTVHHREVLIDLRQVEAETFADQLRQLLDSWAPTMSPSRKLLESSFHEPGVRGDSAIAVVAPGAVEQQAVASAPGKEK